MQLLQVSRLFVDVSNVCEVTKSCFYLVSSACKVSFNVSNRSWATSDFCNEASAISFEHPVMIFAAPAHLLDPGSYMWYSSSESMYCCTNICDLSQYCDCL